MTQLLQAWKQTKLRLEAHGFESPTIEARLIVLAATGLKRNDLITDPYREIDEAICEKIEGFIQRRLTHEPVAHIIGKRGFWTLDLKSDNRALIPRPETEVLVDSVLKHFSPEESKKEKTILDICTGSGAILLALLAERPNWKGLGTDISQEALDLAGENIVLNGLEGRAGLVNSNLAENIEGEFDIITANPPYIPSGNIPSLDKDVKDFEPLQALDGGQDGLKFYDELFEIASNKLKKGGIFVFEFGFDQAAKIYEIAVKFPQLKNLQILFDLCGHQRAIKGSK